MPMARLAALGALLATLRVILRCGAPLVSALGAISGYIGTSGATLGRAGARRQHKSFVYKVFLTFNFNQNSFVFWEHVLWDVAKLPGM